jgi:hypothetical protein
MKIAVNSCTVCTRRLKTSILSVSLVLRTAILSFNSIFRSSFVHGNILEIAGGDPFQVVYFVIGYAHGVDPGKIFGTDPVE